MDIDHVYPNIDEILTPTLLSRIPANLAELIKERYVGLGQKYVTDVEHTDGRLVNACMFKSSIQDALEEIVDAVFNTLVWIFKIQIKNETNYQSVDYPEGEEAGAVLLGLIEIYSILAVSRERYN
jgi:hypothetical protein